MRKFGKSEKGTSALEVAGIAPLIALVALSLVQAAFAAYGITATQTAARQGARAYSLSGSLIVAGDAVDSSLPGWLPATVEAFGPGHGIRVHVNLPDFIPGADLIVTREAVMP